MNKSDFLFLLLGTSFASFKFGEKYLTDKLIPEFRYDVYLNCSFDNIDSQSKFDLYKEDDNKVFTNLIDKEVVDLLVRNEKIPVWIDISVDRVNIEFTTLKLLCAGRYSKDPDEFYYKERGSGPFAIKSPDLSL